jgi:hypothetical protein
MTSGERPFTVGAIFSAQHGHIRSHVRTQNELDEVADVHLAQSPELPQCLLGPT